MGRPELMDRTVIRNVPVYVYGNSASSVPGADRVPERVESVVGDSTVVIFTDGSKGEAESDRMLGVIRALRPAGNSNAPTTRAVPSATIASTDLHAPVPAASNGTLVCNS